MLNHLGTISNLQSHLRLDDYVLYRIYKKKGTLGKHYNLEAKEVVFSESEEQEHKPVVDSFPNKKMISHNAQFLNGHFQFKTSDSVHKLHTDSSGSEYVLSPEFMTDNVGGIELFQVGGFENSIFSSISSMDYKMNL